MSEVATTPLRHVARRRPSRVRSLARRAGTALAWLVIIGMVLVLGVAVLVPRLGGATPYTILTSSMRPVLPPGTLVVMRPVASSADIHPGVVITYQLRSGEPEVVTHRVVAQRTNLKGETEWQTKGDANNVPDENWVRPAQVRGTLWYAVPELGRVNILLSGQEHQLVVYGAVAVLAVYAGTMFAGAARERRRSGRRRAAS